MADLLFLQIVLCDRHILFEDSASGGVFPGSQSHMLLAAVRARMDNLGGGFAGDRKMEFILHHGVKILCDRGFSVIVDAALGEYIGDLLPDAALARPD
ncbi:hypothetical protein SDC9_197124 [bioreactor metagenome]|uniref:Uncharacterized protein n=1 Tax=bioreactor metagenome TaxID=1076179 RepID=A0A645IQG4_9ZZZZ